MSANHEIACSHCSIVVTIFCPNGAATACSRQQTPKGWTRIGDDVTCSACSRCFTCGALFAESRETDHTKCRGAA